MSTFASFNFPSSSSRWNWGRSGGKGVVIDGDDISQSPIVNAVPIEDNEDTDRCTEIDLATEIDFAEILEILCEHDVDTCGAMATATAFPIIAGNVHSDDNAIITAIPLYHVDSFPYCEISAHKDSEADPDMCCWEVDGSRGGHDNFDYQDPDDVSWAHENSLQEIQNFLYLQDIENFEDCFSDSDFNSFPVFDYADYIPQVDTFNQYPFESTPTEAHQQAGFTEFSQLSIQRQRSYGDDASFLELKRQRLNTSNYNFFEEGVDTLRAVDQAGEHFYGIHNEGRPDNGPYSDSSAHSEQSEMLPHMTARVSSKKKKGEGKRQQTTLSRRQLATAQRTRDNGRFRRNQVEWVSVTDLFDS